MGRSRRKRLGQHFLVDRSVTERIVELLEERPPRVQEIGPGRGALTDLLLTRFATVRAVEGDPVLAAGLERRLAASGLQVRLGDALHDPLDELLGGAARWQVAANLPYSVGTAIVRRLMPRADRLTRLVVMLQRELARRLVARPGERGHGLLALERAAWADAWIAFEVPPSCFRPRPRVVSAVLVLEPRAATEPLLEDALRVAGSALTRPRKMLANAVRPLYERGELEAVGLDPEARPGTVPLEGWLALVRRRRPAGSRAEPAAGDTIRGGHE